VIHAKNADVAPITVEAIEGKPLKGGAMVMKPLIKGDEMTFLELRLAAGVASPLHAHDHESIVYLIEGMVKTTIGAEQFIMGPGDVCRHPRGVLHGLEALEDSLAVEIKSPAPDIGAFMALRKG
jgi:quercetin dioxygenase-like cupin family protein